MEPKTRIQVVLDEAYLSDVDIIAKIIEAAAIKVDSILYEVGVIYVFGDGEAVRWLCELDGVKTAEYEGYSYLFDDNE